jgi:serine protease Do
MSLRRRWLIALGALSVAWTALPGNYAQEAGHGPNLLTNESRAKDPPALTRTGARETFVVAAIKRVRGAVVNIHSERTVTHSTVDLFPLANSPNRVNGMGTGIIIDTRGYIVTNQHVVDDVTALRIRLADGRTVNAAVVARHPEKDLAVIKIDPPYPLPVMPIGTANDLMVGETVIAIGNAYGYEHTASLGIVSAIKRDVTLNKDMAYKALIQTDASINPGNSGGPLINIHGELVGVNVAIRAGAQGIGFAIPVDDMVLSVTEMLKTRRRGSSYEGFVCRDVLVQGNDGLVRKVVVNSVDPASPAEEAGLRSGDVLVQSGDIKIDSPIDVERAMLDRKPGDTIPFVVRRKDSEQRVQLPLASTVVWNKLGVALVPVPSESVSRVNTQLHGGLEIAAINPNGMAAKSNLRKRDILVGLHKWETVNADNVTYILNHSEMMSINSVPFFIVRDGQMRSGQLPAIR